jgi:hypothetical protein
MPACFPVRWKWWHYASSPVKICCRNGSCSAWYHCKCSSNIDIWCCVSMYVRQRNSRCVIHWEQILVTRKILYCCKHSSNSHIHLHWQLKNESTSTLTQSIIDLCSVFQFSDNTSLPQSWHMYYLLPACSKYTYAVYHHLEYTRNTTDSTHVPTNFQLLDILPL